MNKSDLKDGMVVELRNGRKLLVMDNSLFDKKFVKEVELDEFVDTLFYIGENNGFDIIKVYKNVRPFIEINCNPIWEREREIDWSKVLVGTKILYSYDNKEWFEGYYLNYFPKNVKPHYILNLKRNISSDLIYCKLAEESKEEVIAKELKNEFTKFCEVYGITCKGCKFSKGLKEDCRTLWILKNYNVTRKDNK